MPTSRGERAGVAAAVARTTFEMVSQQIQAFAGPGAQKDLRGFECFIDAGRRKPAARRCTAGMGLSSQPSRFDGVSR